MPHRIAIGGPRVNDGAFDQPRAGEQFRQLGRARAIHRVDGVSVVGIAEGHRDENEPSRPDELKAVAGQPLWVGDVLEEVAAEHCPRSKGRQSPHIAGICQIGADIDTGQFAHIDMDNLNTTGSQWVKYLMRNPGLDGFTRLCRTAAKIEQRRQTLRREAVEHPAQPTGFRFNHRGVDRLQKKSTPARGGGTSSQTPPPGEHRCEGVIQERFHRGSSDTSQIPHHCHRIEVANHKNIDTASRPQIAMKEIRPRNVAQSERRLQAPDLGPLPVAEIRSPMVPPARVEVRPIDPSSFAHRSFGRTGSEAGRTVRQRFVLITGYDIH